MSRAISLGSTGLTDPAAAAKAARKPKPSRHRAGRMAAAEREGGSQRQAKRCFAESCMTKLSRDKGARNRSGIPAPRHNRSLREGRELAQAQRRGRGIVPGTPDIAHSARYIPEHFHAPIARYRPSAAWPDDDRRSSASPDLDFSALCLPRFCGAVKSAGAIGPPQRTCPLKG